MDKRIYICAAIILVFAVTALLVYNYLEIYETRIYSQPLREVRMNRFYALEKWLKETGHTVRIEKESSPEKISKIQESTAVIFAAAGEWKNAKTYINPWIEQGNSLVICMDYDYHDEIDENLIEYLSGFGIETEKNIKIYMDEDAPDMDLTVYFYIEDDSKIFTIKDDNGYILLAEIPLGKGRLTVTGYPLFMLNWFINREINARLSWRLTGENTAENKGILFVRERQITKTLFGKIMDRGNPVPLGVSAFIVIFLGFWMVIPVFGLVFEEKPKSSRPIRQRFAAEINFLKKYKALDYYLETYDRDLQTEKEYNYRDIINKLRRSDDGKEKFKRGISGDYT